MTALEAKRESLGLARKARNGPHGAGYLNVTHRVELADNCLQSAVNLPFKRNAMSQLSSLVAAEIARIAAEQDQRVTREDAALVGQLAGDIVDAFIKMSADRRALASRNRGKIARDLIYQMLNVEIPPKERRKSKPEPWYAEEWAGPVAGPTVIERDFGIARSTLYKWQRDGHVIALSKGRKKYAFPLRQFVDGRPVRRIKELADRFGSHREAWIWMCAVHPALGEAPIEFLRRGDERPVLVVMP